MQYRQHEAITRLNNRGYSILTKHASDQPKANQQFDELLEDSGPCVEQYPLWHPLAPILERCKALPDFEVAVLFVRGFIGFGASASADVDPIFALCRDDPTVVGQEMDGFDDNRKAVAVRRLDLALVDDGTLEPTQAVQHFVRWAASRVNQPTQIKPWWDQRKELLGLPHGSRSSLFVSQQTGSQIRKIYDLMIAAGVFGSLNAADLSLLPPAQKTHLTQLLLSAAYDEWDKTKTEYDFELKEESCHVSIKDIHNNETEYIVSVSVGQEDLKICGVYQSNNNSWLHLTPTGKLALAEKFL